MNMLSHKFGLLIFGFILIAKSEETSNVTHGNYSKAHHNGTRFSGLCTVEVPTIELLSEEDRTGYVPPGNGSKPGYSRIFECCKGYRPIPHTFRHCEAICEDGCVNGNCTGPNVCVCWPGFVHDLDNNCVPTCPKSCLNGECTSNGLCACDNGYVLEQHGRFCIPHCRGGCGVGGNCTAPEHCECQKGFHRNEASGKCEYYCEGGCSGGTCVGPNKCSCKQGYVQKNDLSCSPECPRGCRNGLCTAPNVCSCKEGWILNKNGVQCDPQCSEPCLNGVCVAPNTCECFPGYIKDTRSLSGNKCVAHCPEECVNGQCSRPNYCICNLGYIKQSKTSNVCVKRERRSAIHWELILPEKNGKVITR